MLHHPKALPGGTVVMAFARRIPNALEKDVLVSPSTARRQAAGTHILQERRCGDRLPHGRGPRNLLLSNSDSNAGPVPTAKPQCKPPGAQL